MKSFLPGVTRKEGTPGARSVSEDDWGVALSGRTPGKSQNVIKRPIKNLGGPWRIILGTIFIFAASQILAYLIAKLWLSFVSLITNSPSAGIDGSIIGQFLFIAIAEGVAIWMVFEIIKNRGLGLNIIGLGRKPKPSDLGRAAVGFIVFFIVLIAISAVLNQFSPEIVDKKQNIGFDNINTGLEEILAFLALVIIPPIGEEILIRGYLYSGLRKVWNFVPAVLVTSFIFGLAHLELGSDAGLVWAAAIDTFILSVILVYLREKTGALYASMLVHMFNNLIAFFVIIK